MQSGKFRAVMTMHHQNDAKVVTAAVITVSDTRTEADDRSGDEVARRVTAAGHTLVRRCIVKDEQSAIVSRMQEWIAMGNVDAILLTGGTGIATRDCTPEAVRSILDVEMPGFGERFRAVSQDEIGAMAMLSRAVAGRSGRCLLFALPGSTAAVKTAMDECVLPILPHAVALARS